MTQQFLCDIITLLLNSNQELLAIPFRQRAKFEGWLKFELANKLYRVFPDTMVEYPMGKEHVDIYSDQSFIELKTPNTSYSNSLCWTKTRPTTNNVDSIIHDVKKLRAMRSLHDNPAQKSFVAFVLFPIDEKGQYKEHLDRVTCEVQKCDMGLQPLVKTVDVNMIPAVIYVAEV